MSPHFYVLEVIFATKPPGLGLSFFSYPLQTTSKNFYSALIRGGATFLEDKRSNKIETIPYFKKRFLYTGTSLRISRSIRGLFQNPSWSLLVLSLFSHGFPLCSLFTLHSLWSPYMVQHDPSWSAWSL